jgi:hypothetical protein
MIALYLCIQDAAAPSIRLSGPFSLPVSLCDPQCIRTLQRKDFIRICVVVPKESGREELIIMFVCIVY